MKIFNQHVYYSLLFLQLFCVVCFNANSQGTPDPLYSITTIESTDHAVLKLRSDSYLADTTTIKFTNMDDFGTGTEFLIQSAVENGLKISSNSDLSANTADSILLLRPDGQVIIGDLKGPGIRNVAVNNQGKLVTDGIEYYFNPTLGKVVDASAFMTPDIYLAPINPGTAVRIVTDVNVDSIDLQWFQLPISLPSGPVQSITVCYSVTDNASDGLAARIRTVRLCRMDYPNSCTVDFDDPSNLTGSLDCYEAINNNSNPITTGSPIVSMQVVLGSDDSIDIGQISVKMK